MQDVIKVYMDQRVAGGRVDRVQVVERKDGKIYTVDMTSKEGKKLSLSLTPPGKILRDVIRPKK